MKWTSVTLFVSFFPLSLIFARRLNHRLIELQYVRTKLELQPLDTQDTALTLADLERRMNDLTGAVAVR